MNKEQMKYVANLISQDLEKDKEIERLQEELKYTIPIVEHNQTIQSNINSYNKLAKYSEELEDRINKAVELLEKYGLVDEDGNFNNYLDTIDLKELYEILKGSE